MKLFTKYSRINVLATIAIFLIASAAYYFTLNYVLIHQIDEDLKIEERETTMYVKEHNRLPENISVRDQLVKYIPVKGPSKTYFTTISFPDPQEKNQEQFRQVSFTLKATNLWYQITISKSLEDTDDLLHSILLISSLTILVILIASFIINRVALKRLWRPFYQSLDAVKEFKISKEQALRFAPEEIEEFRFMNQTLERITHQAQLDYLSLKTFSENASHEIQTPLAIMRSKLDLMIQDENLTEQQSQTLQSAYNAIQKLTRLNQSLLLLAKIENNQFEEVQAIDLKTKIEEKINDFNELWQSRQIKITNLLYPVPVKMNNELADILLNNLLSNATKHNFSDGTIFIELAKDHFTVGNTSNEAALDEKKVFQRFYKPVQSNENNGLGLSIIQQICYASGFEIRYFFQSGVHSFRIQLN